MRTQGEDVQLRANTWVLDSQPPGRRDDPPLSWKPSGLQYSVTQPKLTSTRGRVVAQRTTRGPPGEGQAELTSRQMTEPWCSLNTRSCSPLRMSQARMVASVLPVKAV